MRLILFLFYLFSLAFADVVVKSPTASDSFSGSSGSVTITVEWTDDDNSPTLDDITKYQFILFTGPNSSPSSVTKSEYIKSSEFSSYSYDFTFESTVGPDGSYFIQIYSQYDEGYTLHYSNRFELTDMDGTLSSSVSSVTYTTGPSPMTSVTSTATINSASFSITYTLQTGISRFAPMQLQPGSTVTATSWSRKYPSSAVTFYSTFRTSLDQLTTITPGYSYTLNSYTNAATPAAFPSQNGGWYNPTERMTFTTRKLNLKRALTL